MRESGVTPDQHQKNPVRVFGLAFVFTLISVFALALWVGPAPALGNAVVKGLIAGAFLGSRIHGESTISSPIAASWSGLLMAGFM